MIIQLPNGLIDNNELYNYCEIDELRGKQQNYLANAKLVVNNIGHIPKILEDMVLSFQTEQGMAWEGNTKEGIKKIPVGDLETILIKIRENTYGPKFYHEAVCSHCGHHHKNLRLDLDTLELSPLTVTEMLTPKVFTLPKSGKVVELKPQYLKDLFSAIKMQTSESESMITESLIMSIKSIDSTPPTLEEVDNLPVKDILFLNEEASKIKLEGTIDTEIIIDCLGCKEEFKVKLNSLHPHFFSPTGGIMSLNM